jgi:CHAT domain-containing protein/Tfp pilus assembly protein PilF
MTIALVPALALSALAVTGPQEVKADSGLLALLEAGHESQAVAVIRQRPDDAREVLTELLELTMRAGGSEERAHRLLQARELAELYERAWSDPFLLRRVEQFTAWSIDARAQKLQADSLRRAGITAFYSEGPDAAIRMWEQSLGRYDALGDRAGQAAVLGNLGAGYYALALLERALLYYRRSLELSEAVGDLRTRGNALGNIASVYKDRGEYALAAQYYGRALEVRAATSDRAGEAGDVNNLGLVRSALGDLTGAEEYFRRALELNRTGGRSRAAADNLTNLANVATQRGEYRAALTLYSEALALRRASADRRGEALDLENLGVLHLRQGDYRAAVRSLEAALALADDLGLPVEAAALHSHIAATQAAMGELAAALVSLDRAEARAQGDEWLAPALALQRGDLMAELNDVEAAVRLYRDAKAGYVRLDDEARQAEAEHGLAHLYLAIGDCGAAGEALSRALAAQQKAEDPRPAGLTRILLGDAQLCQGDTTQALESYARALAIHQALGDAVAEAMTLGALADLDRARGRLDAAAAGYRAALARLGNRRASPERWRLHFGLGLALGGLARLDESAAELEAAIAQLDTVGRNLRVDEQRYGYLEDKWEVYAELARTQLARGRVAEAFGISERMRARQLADLLARGRTTDAIADPELIQAEQDLRRRIAALTSRLDGGPDRRASTRDPESVDGELSGLREMLAENRARYDRLLVQLNASRPEYAALVTGASATTAQVQQRLPADAVLIEYLVQDEWALAFVVSKEEVAAVELALNRKTLTQLIHFLRQTLAAPTGELPGELWRTPLRRLHRELIEPLEAAGYLEGRRTLVVVPHAELHYLPFQALLSQDGPVERFLIESHDVVYIPSASVWTQLAERSRPVTGRGLLALAPQPQALAHSAAEVKAIARMHPRSTTLVGQAATKARFRELARDRAIVHLATSASLNTRNPLFSYVRLHPGDEDDGRLEVHEVFGLDLAADLVVLSACETGVGTGRLRDVPAGDDWVGLVRAFLYAGAGSVVASLWPVDDRATAVVMERFYGGLRAGHNRSAALAEAQRAMIREGPYSSPYYWAAFGLTGRWK